MRGAPDGSAVPPDLGRYRRELAAMIRTGSAGAYRDFLREWSDLHQRGVADRLITMDDASLMVRIARMALSDQTLSDTHEWARSVLVEAAVTEPMLTPGAPEGRLSQLQASKARSGPRVLPQARRAGRMRVARPPRLAKSDDQA